MGKTDFFKRVSLTFIFLFSPLFVVAKYKNHYDHFPFLEMLVFLFKKHLRDSKIDSYFKSLSEVQFGVHVESVFNI